MRRSPGSDSTTQQVKAFLKDGHLFLAFLVAFRRLLSACVWSSVWLAGMVLAKWFG